MMEQEEHVEQSSSSFTTLDRLTRRVREEAANFRYYSTTGGREHDFFETSLGDDDDDDDDNDDTRPLPEELLTQNESHSIDNNDNNEQKLYWSPHLTALLAGTQDENSPLFIFRGYEESIIKEIYGIVYNAWRATNEDDDNNNNDNNNNNKIFIKNTVPAFRVGRIYSSRRDQEIEFDEIHGDFERRRLTKYIDPVANVIFHGGVAQRLGTSKKDRPEIAYSICGRVEFPEPTNLNINMMPFIMGSIESLPDHIKPYYTTLVECCPVQPTEYGKVCYLTISESFVHANQTQRRGGLHIEAPKTEFSAAPSFVAAYEHDWGLGEAYSPDELHGGLFMASNINESCVVWNALIDKSLVGKHGDINHLRPILQQQQQGTNNNFSNSSEKLMAGQLCWLTDRTPHEALPQQQDGYRQFFRLVTSNITVWYEKHSTPNPLVPLPSFVTVIAESKF